MLKFQQVRVIWNSAITFVREKLMPGDGKDAKLLTNYAVTVLKCKCRYRLKLIIKCEN